VVDRVETITGKRPVFYEMDCKDKDALRSVFSAHKIDAIIHFAAFKAVGESVEKPLEYYYNNLTSALVVLKAMKKYGCRNFVFSSSATVYGDAKVVPITEDSPLSTTNPYGSTKLMIEDMLRDIAKAETELNIAILRYFNPVGAHKSGTIGEDPNGIPNNLMPFITKVAIGELKQLRVFGNDYPTHDGTGVRDYIHVVDLAIGHIKAIEKLNKENKGLYIYNLGTGSGYSVLEMIKAFEKVNNVKVNYEITERREGDIATCYSDPSKSEKELGFKTTHNLEDMCRDSWNFEKNYKE
jgi:UDP-glucose 4-epimerase